MMATTVGYAVMIMLVDGSDEIDRRIRSRAINRYCVIVDR